MSNKSFAVRAYVHRMSAGRAYVLIPGPQKRAAKPPSRFDRLRELANYIFIFVKMYMCVCAVRDCV